MLFPIISGIILIIIAGIFLSKTKKEKPKEEVIPRDRQPVIIEMIPKGTSNNPVRCIVNDTVYFKVLGYSDYKKENLIELEGSNITWHKYKDEGVWENDIGIENTFYTPNIKGYFDIYINYKDKKLKTSCKVKILVEV